MSLRDEFEKKMIEDGIYGNKDFARRDEHGDYRHIEIGILYEGFLLGRRNTVSVCRCGSIPRLTSKERDHRDYHMTLCPSCGDNTGWHRSEEDSIARWNDRQAKRRTEEV